MKKLNLEVSSIKCLVNLYSNWLELVWLHGSWPTYPHLLNCSLYIHVLRHHMYVKSLYHGHKSLPLQCLSAGHLSLFCTSPWLDPSSLHIQNKWAIFSLMSKSHSICMESLKLATPNAKDKPIMPSKTLHNTHNCQCIKLLLMIIRLNQPVSSDTCYHAQDKINGLKNRLLFIKCRCHQM